MRTRKKAYPFVARVHSGMLSRTCDPGALWRLLICLRALCFQVQLPGRWPWHQKIKRSIDSAFGYKGERAYEADEVGRRSECVSRAQRTGAQAGGMSMTDIMLCPYCVDGGQSMPMSTRSDGNWFVCDRCGHLMLPHNPMYKCRCARCVPTVQAPKIQRK